MDRLIIFEILLDGNIKPSRVNVIDYIGVKYSMHSLRFFENNYPSDGLFEGENWDHLRSYICWFAHSSGYQLSYNGNYGSNKNMCQFVCGSVRVH